MAQFPSSSSASGVWSLKEQRNAQMGSNWPIVIEVSGAPTSVTAVKGDQEATISFVAPANTGGGTISQYRVTSSPGGFTATGSSSPLTVTGLTNGTTYTFTVAAQNEAGYGPESTASNSVVPSIPSATAVDYLVVAGGGGGGYGGGGGGAGGMRTATGLSVTAGTLYTVTVGAGGNAASGFVSGSPGNDSVFSSITSVGGGYGGYYALAGGSGGSGGGPGGNITYPASGTAGQGNSSGVAITAGTSAPYPSGASGGGAGGVGGNGIINSGNVGAGGAGASSSISGTSTMYAGGGGGGGYEGNRGWTHYGGAGGSGGGGAGGNGFGLTSGGPANGMYALPGTANTGGGGGGGGNGGGAAAGGSGIVILRFPDTYAPATTTGSPTYTVSGGYRIYTFTSSGSITF